MRIKITLINVIYIFTLFQPMRRRQHDEILRCYHPTEVKHPLSYKLQFEKMAAM
jgi:hypothetical protein